MQIPKVVCIFFHSLGFFYQVFDQGKYYKIHSYAKTEDFWAWKYTMDVSVKLNVKVFTYLDIQGHGMKSNFTLQALSDYKYIKAYSSSSH